MSRKSEYALIAVQQLARSLPDRVVSVADLSQQTQVPADVLAKVLQGLKRAGVVRAVKGAGGGYGLSRSPAEIRFLDVVQPFEDKLAMVSCQMPSHECERLDTCSLRDPMAALNAFVLRQFEGLTMDVFLVPHQWIAVGTRGAGHPHETSLARRLRASDAASG
ncbi:MAG: Rrf2 family transcriptional regulator [Deltaproteobacteria bacterium]|nr:Rrf2 family transcriptional regulator [Deltaproteobacteria bacterium]